MDRKATLIILISILSLSCSEINRTENLLGKIDKLRVENDSLKTIISEINQKYVFDSVIIRDIWSEKNTYKLNSKIKSEIVFVGYNGNNKTSVILNDTIILENGKKVYHPDTLKMYRGGFKYEKNATENRTTIEGLVESKNKYGKPYSAIFTTSILTRKN